MNTGPFGPMRVFFNEGIEHTAPMGLDFVMPGPLL